MWSAARIDLGLTDEEFLLISPTALGALFDRSMIRRRESRYGFAMVCAEIWNVNNNWDKNPSGFSADNFMPDSESEVNDLSAFADQVRTNTVPMPSAEDLGEYMRRTDPTARQARAVGAAIRGSVHKH